MGAPRRGTCGRQEAAPPRAGGATMPTALASHLFPHLLPHVPRHLPPHLRLLSQSARSGGEMRVG